MTTSWVINPYIRIIQSKLLQPNVVLNGRWTIYSPISNKTSVAVGKDHFPKIIELLLKVGKEESIKENMIDKKVFDTLVQAEIIIDKSKLEEVDALPFNTFYSLATYNYPFRDYSKEGWVERDQTTMAEFSKYGEVPGIFTKRNIADKEKVTSEIRNFEIKKSTEGFNKNFLLQTLYNLLQPKEIINDSDNPSQKKLVPSGGGKHPIEAHVYFSRDFEGIKAGYYVYDVSSNQLIKHKNSYTPIKESPISIILSFRPERPNWRYRDIRSFRAVYIDAGHVLEALIGMLSLVDLKDNNISINQVRSLQSYESLGDWIDEPQLLEVSIGKNINETFKSSEVDKWQYNNLKTNPFGTFFLNNGHLYFEGCYPSKFTIEVSKEEFMILNNCIPSRRKDRNSTYSFLIKKYGKEKIEKLLKQNALIDSEFSDVLYEKIFNWSRKNWYLNLLEHATLVYQNNNNFSKTVIPNNYLKEPMKLLDRGTVRKFDSKAIANSVFNELISRTDLIDNSCEVFINVRSVENYRTGLYILEGNKLTLIDKAIPEEDVRKSVTNQPFAAKGSIDIFFKSRINENLYMKAMISMGRACQKIISIANELDLGCFTTPAINDEYTNVLFDGDINSAFYYLGIGYKG